jgi:hypothetical protein
MIRKYVCSALVCAGLSFAVPAANAEPILADTWYEFGFDGVGTGLTSGAGKVPVINSPDGNPIVMAGDPAWTITVTDPNQYLIVLDAFISVDQFELFDNLASIGLTSVPVDGGVCNDDLTCAWQDSSYSRGVFALGIGDHSFTGIQTLGIGGAGAFMVGSLPPTVPEPATLLLIGTGALAVARRQWRRSRLQ